MAHSSLSGTDPLPSQSSGALAALDTARSNLAHGLDAVRDHVLAQGTENQVLRRHLDCERERADDLQTRVAALEAELASARFELQQREFDLDQERALLVEAQRESTQARDENAGLNERLAQAGRELVEAQRELSSSGTQIEQLLAHRDELQEHKDRLEAHRDHLENTITQLHERNGDLHRELAHLYADLRADNLPELVLKLAASLTGAESGLFTQADGDGTLAQLCLTEMEEMLVGALYDYSRQAAQRDEPLVENDSARLPDGAGLVNLAALPVSAKGQKRGVLLLCNKRSGPFDDDDTRLLLAIGQHAGLALENSRLHAELGEAYLSTIAVLADAIQAKDAYTRGHCEGVARLAVEVGRRLGLDTDRLDQARYAALLHDIGKIGIPDGILLKPSKLLPEEFSIIQKHPQIGRDLVARVAALTGLAEVVLHHHERWDGSGYPQGLSGEEIPLLARIVGAVDAFDAMTTPRPYRSPIEVHEAVEEMRRCAGTQFDPSVVALLAQVVEEQREGEPSLQTGEA